MKECCQNPDNLKVVEQADNKVVRQCAVCGCRHIEVGLDPGVLFAKE